MTLNRYLEPSPILADGGEKVGKLPAYRTPGKSGQSYPGKMPRLLRRQRRRSPQVHGHGLHSKAERIERAIADDVAFLAAHPTRNKRAN
jgi:hypothetical protein